MLPTTAVMARCTPDIESFAHGITIVTDNSDSDICLYAKIEN